MADSKATGWGAEMAAEEHLATYQAFLTGSKWGIGFLIVLLSLMAFFLL